MLTRAVFVFSCSLSVGVLSLVTEIKGMFCGGLRSGLLARITVVDGDVPARAQTSRFVGPCAASDTRSNGWGSEHH